MFCCQCAILQRMGIAARCIHTARTCFLPNDANHYEPAVLKRGPISFISTLLIASKILAVVLLGLFPSTAHLSTITVSRVHELTNLERSKAGQKPLTLNAHLTAAAQKKAQDMIDKDYFAHVSPDGVTPWHWIRAEGYNYSLAGENLAIDFHEAEDLVAAWMASPGHRDNLINSEYTESGLAVVSGEFNGSTSIVVVHMFGTPFNAAPVQSTVKSSSAPVKTVIPSIAPTPTPDTTPPGAPVLTLSAASDPVHDTVSLEITAEPHSHVTLFVNEAATEELTLQDSATITHTIAVSSFPDGSLTLTAHSKDKAGNISPLSSPLVVEKDTTPPVLDTASLSFLVAPTIDTPTLLFPTKPISTESFSFESTSTLQPLSSNRYLAPLATSELTLLARDNHGNTLPVTSSFAPHFVTDPIPMQLTQATVFAELYRNISFVLLLFVLFVFAITFVIRIHTHQIQFIPHTLFIVLLTVIVYWVI